MTRWTLAAFMLSLTLVLPASGAARIQAQVSSPLAPGSSPPAPPVHPAIQSIWQTADGPVLSGEAGRAWLWGPEPIAAGVGGYEDSPTGTRQVVYFDKARLDILDPNAPNDSLWYAQGAQLVTELLSGRIQLGDDEWVAHGPANIPVVGDPGQSRAVTYATLGTVATLPHALRAGESSPSAASVRVGQEVTDVLRPDGSVDSDAVRGSGVAIAMYDEATRHNIAAPFKQWGESQVFPWLYVLGHPLTEPYWVDTILGGTPQRVLVQAFERRVLTYTPNNPVEWRTEAGNVGQHYRAWRGLTQLADPSLAPLAAWTPFGEEIVGAAVTNDIDPFLLTAISRVASGSDPFANQPGNGGRGLVGLRSGLAPANPHPGQHASVAARELARLFGQNDDERAVLAAYYGGDGADPNAPTIAPFVDAVIVERDALLARQASPPAPPVVDQPIPALGSGGAGVYPDGYNGDWWTGLLAWYGAWGGAVDGWAPDPLGYYCTHPGYAPGDRLRLVSSGVSIDCTIGGQPGDPGMPLAPEGIVALNRAAFDRLGPGANAVTVFHLGPASGERTGVARSLDVGPAAYYDPSYDRAWWDHTLARYDGWGNAVPGWSVDPSGFYCVYQQMQPGSRLRLVANGVTLDCTIGDVVADHHLAAWQSKWAVEMSWDTFKALGLDRNNAVAVYVIE